MKKIVFTLSIILMLQSSTNNAIVPTYIISNAAPAAGVAGSYFLPAFAYWYDNPVGQALLGAIPATVGVSAACLLKQYAIKNSWAKNIPWLSNYTPNPVLASFATFVAFTAAGGLVDYIAAVSAGTRDKSIGKSAAHGFLAAFGGYAGYGLTNYALGK